MCTSTIWTNIEEPVPAMKDRATPGSNSVDVQLGRLESHSGRCALEDMLEAVSKPGDVGACTALQMSGISG